MIRDPFSALSPALATILELARWAPSGDNTQPWRLEVCDERHVVVHGFDTRHHCVYDLDGRPSQIALGCLIETFAIAASAHGRQLDAVRRTGSADETPTFDLYFRDDPALQRDHLIDSIPLRSVQRRPLRTRRLTAAEKAALESAVGQSHRILWLEGAGMRWRTAGLMFRSAKIRLTMPEAYRVHRDVIEWRARYSRDRVPDQALGVDRSTLLLMRFVMKSWPRVAFFNRFLAGTWAPRIQMDWLPGLACAAHFVLLARTPAVGIDDHVAAGRAVQRFWLTATRLGLMLQPELTPLIFSRYARGGVAFSETAGIARQAEQLAQRLQALIGAEAARHGVFMGRIGAGPAPDSRSIRREVDELTRTAPLKTATRC